MKKIYSIILTAIFSLVSLNVGAFTLKVIVDNPRLLDAVKTYYNGTMTPIQFDADNTAVAVFPDNDEMHYLYVTPVSGNYITRYYITDEDENVLLDKSGAWKSTQVITVKPEYDYGTLYIETSDTQPTDGNLTVNLKGDPSKVSMLLGSHLRQVSLKEGTQVIPFTSSTESKVYLMPVGVNKFYKVTLDGDVIAAMSVSGEIGGGVVSQRSPAISYQYNLSIKNNSVLEIEVDYPDTYIDCSITLSDKMEGFIKSVTLDGKPVENWTNFQIKMGSELKIVGNTYDYDVDKFTINGEEHFFTQESWDVIVETDVLDINIEGAAIERPYAVTIYTYNWDYIGNESKGFYRYECYRADGKKSVALNNGVNVVRFNAKEVPFSFLVGADSQNDVHVSINGGEELIPNGAGEYTLNLKDGDIVQIALATNIPELPTAIKNVNEANDEKTVNYNLNGQKISSDYKGIVVTKGKKYIR